MTIVGSTYIEKCLYPHWNELYGSGWRAVNALFEHTSDISFYTYLAEKDKKNLELFPAFNEIKDVEQQSKWSLLIGIAGFITGIMSLIIPLIRKRII